MAYRYLFKAVSLLLVSVLLTAPFSFSVDTGDYRDEDSSFHPCGCPKEKIISHTCCCTLSKRSGCALPTCGSPSINQPDEQTSDTPTLCRARCALPENPITDTSGKIKLTAACYLHQIFALQSILAKTIQPHPEEVFPEVSVPPPETVLPS
jgi:hypothetical protein